MNIPSPHACLGRKPAAGFTLVEVMVTLFAALILSAAFISLSYFTSLSFHMMGNYSDLDSQSRNAVDILGREIRNSSRLLAYSTGSPKYLLLTNASAGTSDKITYNSSTSNLVLTTTYYSSSQPQLNKSLLINCDLFNFSLYNRAPNITSTNITFYPATNASSCKVINFSWKCSRTVLGSKLNTESVQTAQISLRNKTQ
jgi:prepilin-type N-terminal cleavage/methylation domain-containing protein